MAIRTLQEYLENNHNRATSLRARTACSFLPYATWRAEEMGRYFPELSALWRDDVLTGESGPGDRGSILRDQATTRERLRAELQQVEAILESARLASTSNPAQSDTPLASTPFIHTMRRGIEIIRRVLRADEAIQAAVAALDDAQPGLARMQLDEALQQLQAVAAATFKPTSSWLDGSAAFEFLLELPPVRRREHLARLYDELVGSAAKQIFTISASDLQTALEAFPDLTNWTQRNPKRYRQATPSEANQFGPASAELVIKPANLNGNFDQLDRLTFSNGNTLTNVTIEAVVTLISSRTTTTPKAFITGEIVGLTARVQSNNPANSYRLVIRSQIDRHPGNVLEGSLRHYITLEKTRTSVTPQILASLPAFLNEGSRYRLKLSVDGNNIKGEAQHIGGNSQPLVLEATDNAYTAGSIGLVASQTVGALFGPLTAEVRSVDQTVTGAPFYASTRRNALLQWDFVYMNRRDHLLGMASEPPTTLTRVAAATGDTPLRGTRRSLHVQEGQVIVDLIKLDQLLDFSLAMTFYLRFAALPTRLADTLMQSGDFARAAQILHLGIFAYPPK